MTSSTHPRGTLTIRSSTGAAAYTADFDTDGNGTINTLDYAQFKKRFGLSFSY